jgi:hypothetical protein
MVLWGVNVRRFLKDAIGVENFFFLRLVEEWNADNTDFL